MYILPIYLKLSLLKRTLNLWFIYITYHSPHIFLTTFIPFSIPSYMFKLFPLFWCFDSPYVAEAGLELFILLPWFLEYRDIPITTYKVHWIIIAKSGSVFISNRKTFHQPWRSWLFSLVCTTSQIYMSLEIIEHRVGDIPLCNPKSYKDARHKRIHIEYSLYER